MFTNAARDGLRPTALHVADDGIVWLLGPNPVPLDAGTLLRFGIPAGDSDFSAYPEDAEYDRSGLVALHSPSIDHLIHRIKTQDW